MSIDWRLPSQANLPDEVLRIAKNAGKIGLTGKFDGTLTAFAADAALATEIGGATCRLQVSSLRDGCRGVLGDVKTSVCNWASCWKTICSVPSL